MNQVRAAFTIDDALLERVAQYACRRGLTPDEVFRKSAATLIQFIEPNASLLPVELEMCALCEAEGYTDYRVFARGRDACIAPFAFSVAKVADMTRDGYGYGARWCYATIGAARAALAAWDGATDSEPQGWHRHPATGRRRPDGDPAREHIGL